MTSNIGCLVEIDNGRRWDAQEMQRQVASRVASFRSKGLTRGNRVLIHFGNRAEFFAELLAIWHLGGCAIPVDSRLTPYEVKTLAKAARARFSVIDEHTNPDSLADIGESIVINTHEHGAAADSGSLAAGDLKLDDDALILFTSGSTGEPKGVVHTHRSLRARWTTLRQVLGTGPYRRSLCVLPTHFGHGLICNCLYPWFSGADLFIAPPFKPEFVMRLGQVIDEHKITFMSSVPSLWTLALTASPPPVNKSLKRIHVGSAPLSKSIWQSIQEWSGIAEVFNAYGITETGSWVAGTTGGSFEPADGLVGEPWGAEIRILPARSVAELAEGVTECAVGEPGMIWLNTPALMKGYFERPDLTAAVTSQGWFMTGDIGMFDDRRRLSIRGRERDEINKGGMKVFPADVDAVAQRFAAVTDVCTFGIDDQFYGENVAVALVMSPHDNTAIQGLMDWLNSHLAEHKRPVRWYLVEQIPRTSRGKINRDSVKAACLDLEPLDLRKAGSGSNRSR